mgnify:CR=1 FL=1
MYSSIFDVITICTLRQNKCTQGKRAPLVKYENVVPEIMLYAPFLDGTLRPCIALLLACLINNLRIACYTHLLLIASYC